MRIISGIRRGHKLTPFEGRDVRPTTDRVKESIFNIIAPFISGAAVLDMFAGSGALGLEAVSRGARRAVFIDKDKRSADIINRNISDLRFNDVCEVRNMPCFDYAKHCRERFDIIFLDPPYNKGFIEPALQCIAENGLLNDSGIVVLESDETDFKDEAPGFTIYRRRKYGRTYITVYENGDKG